MGANKHSLITASSTLLFRIALGVALVVISYLAFTPLDIPIISNLNDKVSHIAAFFCLALLADFSWPEMPWNLPKALSLITYGFFIEVVQAFLPFREFSLWDMAADTLGLLGYALILPLLLRNSFIATHRHFSPKL
ncbi:MAG: VanZ family protein [Candidatus Thiodiazotropha sp.]|jgi:VanZ family protein